MLKSEYVERIVTDILYADLEGGCVDFLKLAYDKLKLQDNKRLMKMRKRHHKIFGNVMNAVFEDIIGIVVEEICRKGNKGLHEDLMDYYSNRFPLIKEEFEECENDSHKWLALFMDIFDSYLVPENFAALAREPHSGVFFSKEIDLEIFQKRTFVLLCCITYGEDSEVNSLFGAWSCISTIHYVGKYDFYGRQSNGGYMEWIEKLDIYKEILNKKGYKTYIENVREFLAAFLGTNSDKIEKEIFNRVVCARPNLSGCNNDKNLEDKLDFLGMQDGLNDICRRYHVSQLDLKNNSNQMYLDIIRRNIEKWCSKELYNSYLEAGETSLNHVMLKKEFSRYEMEKCVSELITMNWFEFYVMNQQKLWDEYYKRFSFDSPEEDIEILLKENSSLKEENSRYKKKIQQYADADAERKMQQKKEAKKNDRKYIEQIASLERQLEEQKKDYEKQCQMLKDRERYIDLLEDRNDTKISEKEVDYSKFYNIRIAFIGGMTETVSRLKAVFSKAAFINNETTEPPHKIDLIVILGGFKNHALAYKYIGLAGKQNINVIYSDSTNVESIVQKVADNI